jgi:hypothetical protein
VRLSGHGLSIELPQGWEGRIFRRRHGDPTLHAGTFALPFEDGEFGTRSTGRMPVGATFVTITEYRVGNGLEPGRGLFAHDGVPLPIPRSRFHASQLLVARRGQRGFQHFFTASGRPFCLYAVIHEPRVGAARADVHQTNEVLGSLRVERR